MNNIALFGVSSLFFHNYISSYARNFDILECGHRIGGDVFNRIYILKPQAEHVNQICHVGVPTNVNILLLPDFYDPKVRIVI
jgi:hypothetical protein